MDENTIVIVEKLTETMKQYGGNLFVIAQKQLYVEVTQFVVVACITVICIMMSKKYLKNRELVGYYDLDVAKMMVTVVICGLLLMLLVSLMTIIQWVINPEYASIQAIISLVD